MSAPVLTRERLSRLTSEFAGFGAVGALGYVTDLAVFNLLLYAGGVGPGSDPLTAKVMSSVAAVVVTYLGNRHWTWQDRPNDRRHREVALFVVFSLIGMAISVVCLGVSHYLLGLTSPLADNVSANVVGLVLGTTFRFWAYRTFVFRPIPEDERERELVYAPR